MGENVMAEKIKKIISVLTESNIGLYAAQASFFLVISAIPFMMLIFTIISLFSNVDAQGIIRYVSSFAPAEVSKLISTVVRELTAKSASVQIISVTAVSALWLASRGITALYSGLNSINGLPKRNYIYVRFISVLYTVAFIVTLVLTLVFIGFGGMLEEFLARRFVGLASFINFIFKGKIFIFFFYLTLIFTLFYKFLPEERMKFRSVLPGAALAAAGWLGFSFFYSLYIDNFADYTLVYGSLAAVVLLMLWLYFCMNIFLFGAQLNKLVKNGFFEK